MAMDRPSGESPLLPAGRSVQLAEPLSVSDPLVSAASPPTRRLWACGWLLGLGLVVALLGVALRGGEGGEDRGVASAGGRGYWPFPTADSDARDGDNDDDDDDDDGFEQLNHELMRLSPESAERRFGARRPRLPTPPRQQKIDHFVVLYMENHAADQFFGCMGLPGFDGSAGHRLPKDPANRSAGSFEITCGEAPYVCTRGPSYDTYAGKFGPDGNPHKYPYSEQDDRYSALHGAAENTTTVKMFSPRQIPVKAAVAQHFGVFNKLYSAVPSASSPNHLFTQSATSCGMQYNALYNDCGGRNVSFPQQTIYDSLREHNVSFAMFMNSTCGLDGKPCHGENPITDDSPSAISTPDVAMEGVARYKERFFSQTVFYRQARDGTLPALSWIHPPIQACDHPCNDIAKGERFLKDVYEALRAGKAWKKTLLLVAYDDAGGYYDHVVPPSEGVPADESPCNVPDGRKPSCGEPFDFRRLGLRTTGMLISPWVAKGTVFQEPRRGPTPTSQFELTSVPATVKNLFNLSSFLTKRDAWAGNFEELLLDAPRDDADCPMHLPDAPPPAKPWDPPPGVVKSRADLRQPPGTRAERRASAVDTEDPVPQHCSSWHGGVEAPCRGPDVPNLKQRRNARLLAGLLGEPEPNVDAMSYSEVEAWLSRHWREWMRRA